MDDTVANKMGPRNFQPTQWSMVLAAADTGGDNQHQYLGELCGRYWQPIYYFIRTQGFGAHDAEDLTQDFLTQVANGKILKLADPLKGRFRSYLLTCCKNFLINVRTRTNALKRGGAHRIVSLQGTMEENSEYDPPDMQVDSPERVFDRQWALSVLKRVLDQLQEAYTKEGKQEMFLALKPTLTGDAIEEGYAKLGERLKMTETQVKVAVHRMRNRYRKFIRNEISATVCTEKEVEDELRLLITVLR